MRQKYKSTKVEYKGIKFDSKLESDYYKYLELQQQSGEIESIETQFRIEFVMPIDLVWEKEDSHLHYMLLEKQWTDSVEYLKKEFNGNKNIPIKLTSTANIYTPKIKACTNGVWIISNKSKKEYFLIKHQNHILRIYTAKKIFTYICDFLVDEKHYIDTKGFKTATYNLKKKLIESLYKIEIKEVTRKDMRALK